MSRSLTAHPSPGLLLNSGFILTGMVTTLLGPLLPVYKARWALSDTQAGYFFVAQFLATTLVTATSTAIIARAGSRKTLVAGYTIMAAGVAMLSVAQWPLALYATFVYGLGLGLAVPATNLFVAAAQRESRNAGALNVVNFFWGVGAVALPALISATGPHFVPHLLAGLAMLLLLVTVCFLKFFPRAVRDVSAENDVPQSAERGSLLTLAALSAAFFLYVGAENAVGGWIASYARHYMAGGSGWALTTASFWGGLLAARAGAPALLRMVREKRLVQSGILLACAGIAIVLAISNAVGISAGAFLAGAGMGPVFPSLILLLTSLLGKTVSRNGGPIFAIGGLGGAALPLLVGVVSTQLGALHFGLWVPLAALAVLFFIYGRISGRGTPLLVNPDAAC